MPKVVLKRDFFGGAGVGRFRKRDNPVTIPDHLVKHLPSDAEIVDDDYRYVEDNHVPDLPYPHNRRPIERVETLEQADEERAAEEAVPEPEPVEETPAEPHEEPEDFAAKLAAEAKEDQNQPQRRRRGQKTG